MDEMDFFCEMQNFSLPASAGLFARSRLRGTQGACLYTTVHVWVLAGLRGAFSGRSKSRNVERNQGIAFRRARANQTHGNPQKLFFVVFRSAAVYQYLLQVPHQPSNAVYFDAATGTTAVALLAFPCVTDVNRASACVRVIVSSKQGSYSKEYNRNERNVRFKFSFFHFCCAVCCYCGCALSPRPSSSVRRGTHGETAAAFQGIPFVATTSGVFVRVRVCACLYAILNTIWAIATHVSPEFHPRSTQTWYHTSQQQRTVERATNLTYSLISISYLECTKEHLCSPFSTCDIVPENKTGFFNTLAGFFSRGRYKTSPAPSMSYWSIFERNLVGSTDFVGSKSNGWPTGPVSIKKSKLGELHETGGLFVEFTLFRSKNRNWASWPFVGTSSLQNRPVPLDSSRKLTNSSLRQQGKFFNVPGRKRLP